MKIFFGDSHFDCRVSNLDHCTIKEIIAWWFGEKKARTNESKQLFEFQNQKKKRELFEFENELRDDFLTKSQTHMLRSHEMKLLLNVVRVRWARARVFGLTFLSLERK